MCSKDFLGSFFYVIFNLDRYKPGEALLNRENDLDVEPFRDAQADIYLDPAASFRRIITLLAQIEDGPSVN